MQVVFFGGMHAQEGGSVLKPIQVLINEVQQPLLRANRNMGALGKTDGGKRTYRQFLEQIELFDGYLQSEFKRR